MWIKSPPHFSDIDGNAVLEKYPNVSDLLSAPRPLRSNYNTG
jgi:hypothetical protein